MYLSFTRSSFRRARKRFCMYIGGLPSPLFFFNSPDVRQEHARARTHTHIQTHTNAWHCCDFKLALRVWTMIQTCNYIRRSGICLYMYIFNSFTNKLSLPRNRGGQSNANTGRIRDNPIHSGRNPETVVNDDPTESKADPTQRKYPKTSSLIGSSIWRDMVTSLLGHHFSRLALGSLPKRVVSFFSRDAMALDLLSDKPTCVRAQNLKKKKRTQLSYVLPKAKKRVFDKKKKVDGRHSEIERYLLTPFHL